MRLFIAEKPSLGRAIAQVLPKPQKKLDGYIQAANGDCVTWCVGHLLEQAAPEVYDPRFKQWRLADLPIIPDPWQWLAKPKTKKQLGVIKKLSKQAQTLVHAGDPDREGQLLVDLVLQHCQLKPQQKQTIQRCLINDLNPGAVSKSLANLRSNKEFTALSTSALTRSRADWLYGINLTRAYTVRGREQGYSALLSVGRVQTPLLGMVVRRDLEIKDFKSHPFYEVEAHIQTASGQQFSADWQPSEACEAYQDEQGRVVHRPLAEHVAQRITNQPAIIESLKQREQQQAAPLPYNLSALQIDAAKRFSMSAQQVLDACQSLYEKYQLITYPRSDCRYLPKQQLKQAGSIVQCIADNESSLTKACEGAELSRKSKAWNDAKVEAHHAIIPTQKNYSTSKLGQREQQLYQLIARQYLIQFYPPQRYSQTELQLRINGGLFKRNAKQIIEPGWAALFPVKKSAKDAATLPALQQGDSLQCIKGEVLDRQTQPPKAFTDATLLAAMTGISRYVKDPELKAILKETDGLGTEATRAGIIELLFKRQFLRRQGKQIQSTETAQALIKALPEICTLPDMTANWEMQLEAISQRKLAYPKFMDALNLQLNQLLEQPIDSQAFSHLPKPKAKTFRRKSTKGKGKSFAKSGVKA